MTIEGQLVLAQTDSAYFAQEFTRLNNEVAQIKAAAAQKEQEDAATIKSSKIREEQSWKEVMAAKAELDSHEKSSGIELEKMRNQANKVITELRKDIKAHADPDDESCEKGLKAVHDEAVKDAKDLKVKAQAAEDRLVILGTNHELELKVTRDESEKTIAVLQDNLQMAEAKLESMVSNHDTKLKDVREESSKTITELRNNLHAADDALNTMRVSNRKIIINLRGEVTDLEGQVQSSKTDLKNIFASNELELKVCWFQSTLESALITTKAMREKTDGLEKDLQDAESVNNDLSTQAANDINAALSAHDSARQEIETQAAEITMLRDKTVKLENWSKRLDDCKL